MFVQRGFFNDRYVGVGLKRTHVRKCFAVRLKGNGRQRQMLILTISIPLTRAINIWATPAGQQKVPAGKLEKRGGKFATTHIVESTLFPAAAAAAAAMAVEIFYNCYQYGTNAKGFQTRRNKRNKVSPFSPLTERVAPASSDFSAVFPPVPLQS